MEGKKLWLVVGIAVILIAVLLLLFYNQDTLAGQAASDAPANYVGRWAVSTSSGTVKDISSYELDGSSVNKDPGDEGYYLSLDGTDQYVEIDNAGHLVMTDELTISVWVHPETTAGKDPIVMKEGEYELFLQNGGIRGRIGNTNFDSDHTIGSSVWTHIALIYDGDDEEVVIYVNGNALDELDAPDIIDDADTTLNNLWIGGEESDPANKFEGFIDDIIIYNKVLTENQIEDIFNGGQVDPCFNSFCPEFSKVRNLQSASTVLENIVVGLSLTDSMHVPTTGSTTSDYKDVGKNGMSFTRAYNHTDGFTITSAPVELSFFKHNGRTHTVWLTAYDEEAGTADLEIRSTSDTIASMQLTVEDDPDKLYFIPQQVEFDADEDGEIDGYLHVTGFFDNSKRLRLLLVITPTLDFDALGGVKKLFMTSGFTQESTLNQEIVTLVSNRAGDGFILEIGGEEQEPDNNDQGTYWLTVDTFGITYGIKEHSPLTGVPDALDKFGLVEFDRHGSGLTGIYEETFTKTKKVTIGGNAFHVCTVKDAKSLISVAVCIDDQIDPEFSLWADQPTEKNLGGNDYLFYFPESTGDEKVVSVFNLFDITDGPITPQDAYIFVNNLLDSQRMALKIVDLDGNIEYALLGSSSPESSFFETEDFELNFISRTDLPNPILGGDNEIITFDLPVERETETASSQSTRQVQIQRLFEPVGAAEHDNFVEKFVISSETAVGKSVDLLKGLETSFTSYSSVEITSPTNTLGTMTLDDTTEGDNALHPLEMKILYGPTSSSKKTLPVDQPEEIDGTPNILIHYPDPGEGSGGVFVKQAFLRLLLHITGTNQFLTYTPEDFILPIMKGRSLALELDSKYYLLSYSEEWDGTEFFNLDDLDLERIGEHESISDDYFPADSTIRFNLADGRSINITTSTDDVKVYFKAVNEAEAGVIAGEESIIDFYPDLTFKAELPRADGSLRVVGSGKTYRNCDTEGDNTNSGKEEFIILCDETGAEISLYEDVQNDTLINNILIIYHGFKGGKKQVTFHKILDIPADGYSSRWKAIHQNLSVGNNPVFRWNDVYYELFYESPGTGFSNLALKNVTDHFTTFRNSQFYDEAGEEEGVISVNENLLSVENKYFPDTFVNQFYLSEASFSILNPEGFIVANSEDFISEVAGDVYTVEVDDSNPDWFGISIYPEGEDAVDDLFFYTKLPVGQTRSVLLPDGSVIIVDVFATPDPDNPDDRAYDTQEVRIRK